MTVQTAASLQWDVVLKTVPVQLIRVFVKTTQSVAMNLSVAITTAISMARLPTAAAPLLPGARPSVPVLGDKLAAVRMTSAEDPPDVEMTESAPVLKTAPRPRVTGTAAPRSVPVKRGRGTAMTMGNVQEASCVVWITVRGYTKETAAAPLLLGAAGGVPVTRARLAAVKMRTAEDH